MERRQAADLARLHLVFLQFAEALRKHEQAKANSLLLAVVDDPETKVRLRIACRKILGTLAEVTNVRNDVLQGSSDYLLEHLPREALTYQDRGVDQFGGWLYTTCRSACAEAWTAACRSTWLSTLLIDPVALESIAANPEREHPYDQLWQGIEAIPDPLVREVTYEMASGVDIATSAASHKTNSTKVFWLRQEGIAFLRRFFRSAGIGDY